MSETTTIKRTSKKGRVCCELTLKFFAQFDVIHGKTTKDDETMRQELVKWVVAPDRETLRQWLESHRLTEHLDGPYREMPAFMSESYTEKEGVDVILAAPKKKGEAVEVTFPESFEPLEWKKAVLKAAEVYYKGKMKWKANDEKKPSEWKSGKYKIHVATIRETEAYCLTMEMGKNAMRTIGDYASMELAQVAALRDANQRKATTTKEE